MKRSSYSIEEFRIDENQVNTLISELNNSKIEDKNIFFNNIVMERFDNINNILTDNFNNNLNKILNSIYECETIDDFDFSRIFRKSCKLKNTLFDSCILLLKKLMV